MERGSVPARNALDEIARRERAERALAAVAVLAVLLGTSVLSLALLSIHEGGTIVIEPGSHYTVHVAFYGFGAVEYSHSMDTGPEIYLLELDRRNYDKFISGEDYEYTGYQSLGYGGSGTSMMAGFILEIYFVFVNEEEEPASFHFEIKGTCYFSLLMAMPVLGAVATIAYAMRRRFLGIEPVEEPLVPAQGGLTERRKALLVIAGLVVLPIAIMYVLGLVIPTGIAFFFQAPFYRLYAGVLITSAIVYLLRFRLTTIPGEPEHVLPALAHQLRASRMRVTERPGLLSVQVSSLAAIRIKARAVPEGTLVTYRADATPAGWSIIAILLIYSVASPLSLAFSLYILYRSAGFAGRRILPKLSGPLVRVSPTTGLSTRTLLIEGLSEARRLSAESYEAARSNYQDAIIVMVTIAFLMFPILAWFTGAYLLEGFTASTRILASFGVGMAAAVSSSLVSWRLLAAKKKSKIEDLRLWSARLEVALSREIESKPPLDAEPSSFELIASAYEKLPEWLRTRRRAGMFREPGDWLLIFWFSLMGAGLGLAGILDLSRGSLTTGAIFLALAVCLAAPAALLYMKWNRRLGEETARTTADWGSRFASLKAQMEKYLGSV